MLSRKEIKETLKAYADYDMNIAQASAKSFIPRETFSWRLRRIHELTGKNPRKFWELLELLAEYEEAEVVRDGILSILSRMRG